MTCDARINPAQTTISTPPSTYGENADVPIVPFPLCRIGEVVLPEGSVNPSCF
jgi:hypothetical protein